MMRKPALKWNGVVNKATRQQRLLDLRRLALHRSPHAQWFSMDHGNLFLRIPHSRCVPVDCTGTRLRRTHCSNGNKTAAVTSSGAAKSSSNRLAKHNFVVGFENAALGGGACSMTVQ